MHWHRCPADIGRIRRAAHHSYAGVRRFVRRGSRSVLPKFSNRLSPGQQSYLKSDRERSTKLFSFINKFSTIVASMHWTLLRFDERRLITGDQPVCPVPLLTPGVVTPIEAVPRGGWLDTCELRFPLTPTLALLGTWHMGAETTPVTGTWAQAINLNVAVRKQAVKQYFQTPELLPATPPAIDGTPQLYFLPISIEVIPGYSMGAARQSPLRHQTVREIQTLIDRQDRKTMTVVTSRSKAA